MSLTYTEPHAPLRRVWLLLIRVATNTYYMTAMKNVYDITVTAEEL